MLKSALFLLVTFTIVTSTLSQSAIDLTIPAPPKKDYIQLKDGNMLIGDIQYDSIKNIIYFKATDQYYEVGNGKFEIVDNSSVVEFKNEKNKYVRQVWDGEERFVLELVKGEVSLYSWYDNYFVRSKGENIPLPQQNFKDALSGVYREKCGWSFNSNFLKYSKAFMKHIVKGYNNLECFKVQRKQIGLRFNVINTSNTVLVTTEQIEADLEKSASVSIGIQAEVPTYKRSTIFVSLDFMSQTFDEDFVVLNFTDIDVKISQFILQVGPKFYFNKLSIEAGPTIAHTINGKSSVSRPDADFPLRLGGMGLGIHYAVGYKITNGTATSVSLELRNTKFRGNDLTTRVSSLGLFIGF